MPSQIAIQNTILQSQLKAAYVIKALTDAEISGRLDTDWFSATRWYFNIQALQKQFNLGDYTSTQTVAIYDCLNVLIGLDTSVIVVDPNYQPPSGNIVVVNPASYLSAVVLGFNDFDPASQQIDGGRTTYINPAWTGIDPIMSLASPGETFLRFGIDYTLLPTGGFTFISIDDGGQPGEIYPDQYVVVGAYREA